MRYADYHQATGLFRVFDQDQLVYSCTGYAGHGDGVNNPDAETVVAIGPIPCGVYRVGDPYTHPSLGPITFNLNRVGGDIFGRCCFRIHGDNRRRNRSASNGCIVLDRAHRQRIASYGIRFLLVHTFDGEPGLPEGLKP